MKNGEIFLLYVKEVFSNPEPLKTGNDDLYRITIKIMLLIAIIQRITVISAQMLASILILDLISSLPFVINLRSLFFI